MPEETVSPGQGQVQDESPGPKLSQPSEARNILRPVPEGSGSSGLSQEEENKLAELQAKAAKSAAGSSTVDVRVEGAEMLHGGYTIGENWVTVPQTMIGPLTEAAANGGLELIQKES